MPWEKNFNPDEALEKAMKAFWKNGYEPTSMQDLLDCMGIQRGSFYATFENKHTVFKMALERYEKFLLYWFAQTESKHSPKASIIHIFETTLRDAKDNPDYNGCFMVNTALELAPHDPEVGELVARGFAHVESFFLKMIKKGQADGSISKDLNAKNTARVLMGLMSGLRVLTRTQLDISTSQALVNHAKNLLG